MDKTVRDITTPILIVDDSAQYTTVLRKVLEGGFGYRDVTTVSSATDAYDLISENPERFRILFVDYSLQSGTTGGQLLERLQNENLITDKVAFLITSDPTVENMKQAKAAGALAVVAKPFDREELKTQLDKADRLIKSSDPWS